jgi:hypothetical protein
MLKFEYDPHGEMLVVAGDGQGLRELIEVLDRLAKKADAGTLDHEHLKSEVWGGFHLTPDAPPSTVGAVKINHVKIYAQPA